MAEEEDEISLIDLLAVLIRWRQLIVGLTVAAAIAVVAFLFALPIFGIASNATYTIQAVVVPTQLPPSLRSELAMNTVSAVMTYATELNTVVEGVARNKLGDDPIPTDVSDWKFRTYISKSFIGKQYKVRSYADSITFEITTKQPEAAKIFLVEMIASSESRVRADIAARSALIEKSMESLYKDAATASTLSEAAKQLIISSWTYMNGNVPILITASKPEVLVDPQGRAKTVAVVVMAALFLSIFLAFVLEYASKIKDDPESMEKIRKAFADKPSLVKRTKKN
ncbi:MAG: hypothetical protein WCT14_21670 [Treponemataceae bacterium]